MASSFTYIGSEPRYYPEQGVHAEPADGETPATTATFDSKPDEHWASSSSKKAAAVKADSDPAPAPAAVDNPSKA